MAAHSIKNIFELACTVYPLFRTQIDHIAAMPLRTRSVLIKCCQAQSVPPRDTPLGKMITSLPPYHVFLRSTPTEYTPYSAFSDMQHLISGQVTSAILLDLCRALPISFGEMMEARENGWKKEGIKIEEPERECKINWAPIFSLEKCNESMLDFLPPNPSMNKYIYAGLYLWRKRMVDRVLLPRHTRKNMSRATRRCYEAETGISLENTPIFSQEDWLRYYHETGIKLGGATEMRQKWYASGAKPRTYFAQGGHHYQYSSYLQDSFTSLVNTMPFTHHVTRLIPSRLTLRQGHHFRVYDLSTFTSNMAEQRGFVKALAEFCIGVRVYVFDANQGILEHDLGELLYLYHEECVLHPEVSYERVPGVQRDISDVFISDHGVASMLGIFGNLMTCTFAHGCLLAQTVESEDLLNVAGDDGLVEETPENEKEVDWCIRTLGECEITKTFLTCDEGAICLKRPIWEELGVLKLGFSCIPPSLITFAHYVFDLDDPRYNFHSDIVKQASSFSIVGKDLMRFLRSVHRVEWNLDDVQLSYASEVVERWTRVAIGSTQYFHGLLPHSGDPYLWPCTMSLEDWRSKFDPLDILLINRYRGVATLPILDKVDPGDVALSSELEVGDVLRGNSSWVLSMAATLGYVRRQNLSQVVWGIEGYQYIKRVLTTFDPHVYEFEVLKPIHDILL